MTATMHPSPDDREQHLNPIERFVGMPYPTEAGITAAVAGDPYVTESDVQFELAYDRNVWKQAFRSRLGAVALAPLEFVAGESMPDLGEVRRAAIQDSFTAGEVDMAARYVRRQWLGKLVRAEGLRERSRKFWIVVGEAIEEINDEIKQEVKDL